MFSLMPHSLLKDIAEQISFGWNCVTKIHMGSRITSA